MVFSPGSTPIRSVVTGGAGFIGSNLADALTQLGGPTLLLDDLSSGSEENVAQALDAGARLIVGDVMDSDFVKREIAAFEPDLVFHLAAQADVRRAVSDPGFDAAVNIGGTINVLEGARRIGNPPVVFAATGGAVYGEGEGRKLPFDEGAAVAPQTPYGVSKFAGEGYVALYRRLHGLSGVSMRFANVYGPRQDPHGEAGVVAIFCGKLLAGEVPTIYGDGGQTRDYVYVGDAVAALVSAGWALRSDPSQIVGPYNVGTGTQTSVTELFNRLVAIAGIETEPVLAQAREGEVRRISLDSRRALADLGWRPEYDLERGLRESYDGFRRHYATLG